MADGVVLNAGSGGDTLGADDIGGTKYQIQKVGFGALDSLTLAASGAGAVSAGVQRTTLASDDPAVALLGTIDGDTGTLAGAVSGTEMQVDVVAALPAGNNNIGDVDVASIVPGTGATNLGKAEDAAHSSGDVGVMALSVRQDTAAALGQTDADYQPLITDGSGRLHVNVGNTVAVSGTVDLGATDNGVLDAIAASVAAIDTDATTIIGHVDGIETLIGTTNTTLTTIDGRVDGIEGLLGTTNTNTGNAATSLAIMDDWDNAASDGASVSGDVAHDAADAGEPVKIGGYAKASAPTDVSADGDRVNAWFDLGGRLAIQDGGLSLSIDDGGNVITVDGTVAVTNGGLTELAAAINASSQMDVNIAASNATVTVTGTVTADLGATDNAVLDAIAASVAAIDTDATTIIGHVDGIEGLLSTIDADTGSILTAVQLIDDTVFTDDAAFTPASSKGLATGYMVDSTATDSVDEGDFGVARMTADRAQIVVATERSGLSYESDVALAVKYAAIDAASSGDNTLVSSVSGKKIRVLSCFLVAAGTVNVRFESGAGGTALSGQMNLIANTGFVLPHNPHGWFQTADTTLLNLELSGAVSVDGSLTYIEAE